MIGWLILIGEGWPSPLVWWPPLRASAVPAAASRTVPAISTAKRFVRERVLGIFIWGLLLGEPPVQGSAGRRVAGTARRAWTGWSVQPTSRCRQIDARRARANDQGARSHDRASVWPPARTRAAVAAEIDVPESTSERRESPHAHLQRGTCALRPKRSDPATWVTSASYAAFSAAGYSSSTLFQIWSPHDRMCLA